MMIVAFVSDWQVFADLVVVEGGEESKARAGVRTAL